MPKIYEKGYAQTVTSKTGYSQQGQGCAQLKGRAMPKISSLLTFFLGHKKLSTFYLILELFQTYFRTY